MCVCVWKLETVIVQKKLMFFNHLQIFVRVQETLETVECAAAEQYSEIRTKVLDMKEVAHIIFLIKFVIAFFFREKLHLSTMS